MGGGTHGVCVCLGSVQRPELDRLPWGHHVTPRDITAVWHISTLRGIVTLQGTVTLWDIIGTLWGIFTLWSIITPRDTVTIWGIVTPWSTVTLWGISTLWDIVTLQGVSTLWGVTPCSIVSLQGNVAHRALSLCASPCAGCQLSAPPTCFACAGTRWLSVTLPA